jgi:hypothetical protein
MRQFHSLQRCGGGLRDTSMWVVTTPTPGAANSCPTPEPSTSPSSRPSQVPSSSPSQVPSSSPSQVPSSSPSLSFSPSTVPSTAPSTSTTPTTVCSSWPCRYGSFMKWSKSSQPKKCIEKCIPEVWIPFLEAHGYECGRPPFTSRATRVLYLHAIAC